MKRIVLFFLFVGFVWGADFNASLATAPAKVYERMLSPLTKEHNVSDDIALREALLNKLISLAKTPPPKTAKILRPQSEKDYRTLVRQLINASVARAEIERNLDSLEHKIALVKSQLGKLPSSDTTLPTKELEYAFYLRGKQTYETKKKRYDALLKEGSSKLIDAVKTISFDTAHAHKVLRQLDANLTRLERQIQEIKLEQERYNLMGRSWPVHKLNNRIAALNLRRKELLDRKLLELFILFSGALQSHESKKAFTLQKKMQEILAQSYSPPVQNDFQDLSNAMERKILGRIETIKGATYQEIKSAFELFWEKLNAPLFHIGTTDVSTLKISLALLIFLLGIFLGGLFKRTIRRLENARNPINPATRTLIANLGYYFIVIIAFFMALNAMGINLSSIALVAGALSVGIGFGLQNVVSNFVSGLILMFERSIKIGDFIEINENLRGHVSDIRMRSTTISTNDNIDVVIPNQELIQNRVINWTMNDRIRRFRIPFGVAYGTDAQRVIRVVTEALLQSGFKDLYQDKYRRHQVIMTGMGDSSVDFELFVWIKGETSLYPLRTRSRFLLLIYKALYEHQIEIPFPQRDLHLRSAEAPLRVVVESSSDADKES